MLKRSRKHFHTGIYQVWGGNKLIHFIIAMGIFYASCHILAMLDLLPVYGRVNRVKWKIYLTGKN